MTHDLPATGYTDGDVDTNASEVPSLETLADQRYSRRQALFRGAGATTMAFMGTALLAACSDDDDNASSVTISAGANAATSSGRVVTLTGTPANGTDGVATAWAQTSGTAVTLTGTGSTVTFIAPAVSTATDLVFTFAVVEQGGHSQTAQTTVRVSPNTLGFTAVPHGLADVVAVPTGYSVTVMTRLGDPLSATTAAYANNGTDADFAHRIGDHGDALHFFGLSTAGARDDTSSTRGLMVQNHENLNVQYLHPNGPTNVSTGPRPVDEALKEIEAHGVSVSEYKDAGSRKWAYVQNSTFNRRITPNTPMAFNGPAAGSAMLFTAYSPTGKTGRGTINNCANGITPWATNLTCEENWAGYFRRDAADDAKRTVREMTAISRYGVTSRTGNFAWSTANSTDSIYTKWNATITGATAADDYRNEFNQYGWVVEIDPYDPASTPRKRTALGRMGHEGAFVRAVAGQKLGLYMGDDSRREYLYKFVSSTTYAAADAASTSRLAMGDKYLDAGTLYVAKFNADGTGKWLPLVFGQVPNRPVSGTTPEYVFADQADILVNTRLAADAVGATPMDRPEWTAGNPVTGEIYLTLTNNNAAGRPLNGTDAANPRHYNDPKGASNTAQYGNPNGHIIRLREDGDTTAATTFKWDIYLFGADATDADPTNVNISGLTVDNDFSSPDGCYFSRDTNPAGQINPVLWIETDDGAMTDRTNCMLLAALPGKVGDGGAKTITNKDSTGATATQATIAGKAASAATLRRFLVGPVQCEITGIDMTPDGRTLFVGIQHPGEEGTVTAPSSHWPDSQTGTAAATVRPRSAIVAITKDDGGVIAL
ncbi:alkaline phosphatase PhoX [Novosphingobium sp. BL-8A]|uniref:PhoX family protein n=1 Tax=Novosphingobium sp. BL-8A TaxID=3127639 RepID=UPI0037571A12